LIYVCDSIMGSGKSSAAITYMNERPDQKFVYITPYLEEARRIRDRCPFLHFSEPSNKIGQYQFSKLKHTAALIAEGRNIATTHQAFKGYLPEMLEQIRDKGYTLIIDECVDVLEVSSIHPDDLKLIVDAGYVKLENGEYKLTDMNYAGNAYAEVFSMLRSHSLIQSVDSNCETLYYWALSPELVTSFKDVFVLTYLFHGQGLCRMFEMYGIGYGFIGTRIGPGGAYRFGPPGVWVPPYVHDLSSKIHVLDNDKMNEAGDGKYSLSLNWYSRAGSQVAQMKNNLSNWFNNMHRETASSERMWGAYKNVFPRLKGKGYTNSFVIFNAKATNEYGNRTCLAYPINIFMNSNEKVFYFNRGLLADEDIYAQSIMVQWIWRSAIRNGKDIYIYMPSERMRALLFSWIYNAEGKEVRAE